MKALSGAIAMLFGLAWVAGAIYMEEVHHWHALSATIASLPGVFAFLLGAMQAGDQK